MEKRFYASDWRQSRWRRWLCCCRRPSTEDALMILLVERMNGLRRYQQRNGPRSNVQRHYSPSCRT